MLVDGSPSIGPAALGALDWKVLSPGAKRTMGPQKLGDLQGGGILPEDQVYTGVPSQFAGLPQHFGKHCADRQPLDKHKLSERQQKMRSCGWLEADSIETDSSRNMVPDGKCEISRCVSRKRRKKTHRRTDNCKYEKLSTLLMSEPHESIQR